MRPAAADAHSAGNAGSTIAAPSVGSKKTHCVARKTSVPNAAHTFLRLLMSVMLVSAVLGAGTV
jgi:hypothetical protein